ncbi:ATP-binding protein, partial [Staphylococcus aureus]
ILFIDECHNIINANNREVVNFTKNFMKEMRKYLAGIMLATQSPQELLPQGNDLIVNDLKQIFELTQYKFLLGMDQSTLDKLENVLGDTIKESEYQLIPKLDRGQAILSIAGESIVFDVQPSKEQLARFSGGL